MLAVQWATLVVLDGLLDALLLYLILPLILIGDTCAISSCGLRTTTFSNLGKVSSSALLQVVVPIFDL